MQQVQLSDLQKDWRQLPKFRHNLWTTFSADPEVTYLAVSHGTFEVPTTEAHEFLKIRGFCTGHHTVEEIAQRSGVAAKRVNSILSSLFDADIDRPGYRPFNQMTDEERRKVLFDACRIWAEQLAETGIAVDIQAGLVSKSVVIGWLLELYHYIKDFPACLDHAARHSDGALKAVLSGYAEQERGHERFVLESLVHLGLKKEEVEKSIPLVSTRLIGFLMRELYEKMPMAALLVASIVEANELEEEEADSFRKEVARHYGIAEEALSPIQEHMMVDAQLDHALLAQKHTELIKVADEDSLHALVNQLHDIKHAFDVQKLEIKDYYSREGNYLPRQFVDFFAI